MKKVLCLLAVAAIACAACSKNRNASTDGISAAQANADARAAKDVKNIKDAKYQIIDQEFDNLLASEKDYDNVPAYELQACGESYLPLVEPDCCGGKAKAKGQAKAKAKAIAKEVKTARAKRVTNTTNIYYVDGPNPDIPVSSTTTTKTVYSNGTVSSSTSSSSNSKTTVNADGSVTTTTVNY